MIENNNHNNNLDCFIEGILFSAWGSHVLEVKLMFQKQLILSISAFAFVSDFIFSELGNGYLIVNIYDIKPNLPYYVLKSYTLKNLEEAGKNI